MPPTRPLPTRPPTSQPRSKSPAHLPLHRRLLFPTFPPNKPLPRIVLGSDPELDVLNERIYHLLALLLRAYVLSWYPTFSKDRTLLPILTSTVILPVLSPILNDISPVRLIDLVLLDFPTLLTLHITTYHAALNAIPIPGTAASKSRQERITAAYHARLPLLCVEEGSSELSSLYLTCLADALLKLYLPPTEYAVETERIMLRELLGRVVLGGIGRKISQGWFWFSLLLKLFDAQPTTAPSAIKNKNINILQVTLGFLMALWTGLMGFWKAGVTLTEIISVLPQAPDNHHRILEPWLDLLRAILDIDGTRSGRRFWRKRLSFGALEMILNPFHPLFDRLLPHMVQSRLLTTETALKITRLLEDILFPVDGYPGPTPPDPTPEEIKETRGQLEQRIKDRLPHSLQAVFFPIPSDLSAVVDPLANTGCNAHLVGMMLEAAVGAVVPDLLASEEVEAEQVDDSAVEGDAMDNRDSKEDL
ncbi:PXA domain-domain-containing protein [Naematelia encephala]|uniref:PXA domain-domain-containing protein n=1 Tax=Naematelia encephala TaxID=71784 RepID=A0A1Y2BKJ1_9TREE|nr:PXA domain-domain-containing protein [Naematelia encephala]